MSESIDEDKMLESLGVANPYIGDRYPEDGAQALSFDSPVFQEAEFDNQTWLQKIGDMRTTMRDTRSLALVSEIVQKKRRTMQWLSVTGYQGVLDLWRNNTLGIRAVQARFEEDTGDDFSIALILDFMESHDSWLSDLDDIYRTHAFMHEADWQEALEDADDDNMVSVALAKQKSQLMFERAGTLNRERFSRVPPKDEMNQGNIINVTLNTEGRDVVGADATQMAHRQQLTAKARVKYGTGQYVNPPGLIRWQSGMMDIPESKVDDYLMLKWLPDEYADVIPEDAIIDAKVEALEHSVASDQKHMIDTGNL